MNRKTIIEIVVIVGAFLASGIVLYNGLFKSGAAPEVLTTTTSGPTEKILPYGDTFNYKQVQDMRSKNFQFGAVSYPKLDPDAEVKKELNTLIKPTESIQQ